MKSPGAEWRPGLSTEGSGRSEPIHPYPHRYPYPCRQSGVQGLAEIQERFWTQLMSGMAGTAGTRLSDDQVQPFLRMEGRFDENAVGLRTLGRGRRASRGPDNRRVRNALVHGNPAGFAIVDSVHEYAKFLSGRSDPAAVTPQGLLDHLTFHAFARFFQRL